MILIQSQNLFISKVICPFIYQLYSIFCSRNKKKKRCDLRAWFFTSKRSKSRQKKKKHWPSENPNDRVVIQEQCIFKLDETLTGTQGHVASLVRAWEGSADTNGGSDYLLSCYSILEALDKLLTKIRHPQLAWDVYWQLFVIILDRNPTKAKVIIGKFKWTSLMSK